MEWEIRPVGPDDWRDLKDIRLRALRDAPTAFGSTYEREAAFTEADWRQRLTAMNFLAYTPVIDDHRPRRPIGIVGGFESRPGTIALVAMWIDAAHRGSGLAEPLVTTVLDAARRHGAERVELRVTQTNIAARRLYERCGFEYTGEHIRLESDPTLDTLVMTYELT